MCKKVYWVKSNDVFEIWNILEKLSVNNLLWEGRNKYSIPITSFKQVFLV